MISMLIRRSIAFVIDVLTIYTFSYLFLIFLKINTDSTTLMLFAGFYSIIYFVAFWVKFYGKTPGSNLMGVKTVKSSDLSYLDFKTALYRAGMLLMIICPIGIVKILALLSIIQTVYLLKRSPFKERQQTIWDIAAKTLVVKIADQKDIRVESSSS